MSEQITTEEVLQLASFEKVDGEWCLKEVLGDVKGKVFGSVNAAAKNR